MSIMKKLLFLFALTLVSCSDNKKSMIYDIMDNILIEEFEMSASDLDLEIISLENIGIYTVKDSIEEYLSDISWNEYTINNFSSALSDKEELKNDILRYKNRIDSLNFDKDKVFGDSILMTISVIKNPFEGNVKRTTRFNYILSKDGLNILDYDDFRSEIGSYFYETLGDK